MCSTQQHVDVNVVTSSPLLCPTTHTSPTNSAVIVTNVSTALTDHSVASMGNSQTNRKSVHEDDDTPEENKSKCCNVPKKKAKEKEKAKRASRCSRTDDLTFESNEVYPFEAGSRSEQELSASVELEPFEIVETDDIRFVPGAGTSDVIKSVSEPKFTTIPEETLLEEDDDTVPSASSESTDVKHFYIDKGSKFPEPGTSTAHSTFEFKQIKVKNKSKPATIEQENEHLYQNVRETAGGSDKLPMGATAASTSKSPDDSSNSSRNVSRKNSKEAIPKPARKSKKGKQTNEAAEVLTEEQVNSAAAQTEACPGNDKQPSVRDSEIDRNIDSVLMLTQTMFSKTKNADAQISKPPELATRQPTAEEIAEGKYENVNVCVKLEPTGIAIAHKETKLLKDANATSTQQVAVVDTDTTETQQGNYENVGMVAKLESKGISMVHKESKPLTSGQKEHKPVTIVSKPPVETKKSKKSKSKESDKKKRRKASEDKEFVEVSRQNSTSESLAPGILHISDSGTLIIKADKKEDTQCTGLGCCPDTTHTEEQRKGMLHISDTGTLIINSLPMPPQHAPSSERGSSHYYENDIVDKETTDVKLPFEEAETEVLQSDANNYEYLSPLDEKLKLAKLEDTKAVVDSKEVPPPSPKAMAIVEEEEEDEEDDEYFTAQDMNNEENRKSREMAEFTENVCKRLSQLLEEQPNEDYLFQSGTFGITNPANEYETIHHDAPSTGYDNVEQVDSVASTGYDNVERVDSVGSTCYDNVERVDSVGSTCYDNVVHLGPSREATGNIERTKRSGSSSTLKRVSGDSETCTEKRKSTSSDDDLPEYFDPRTNKTLEDGAENDSGSSENVFRCGKMVEQSDDSLQYESLEQNKTLSKQLTLPLRPIVNDPQVLSASNVEELRERTPTAETANNRTPLTEMATVQDNTPVQFEATQSGRRSATCTESDIDISEHRDDLSTDSMLADDEDEETMEILFTKTYTEPVEGAEVFLSCTVVNSAFKDEKKKSDTWLSDEALEYLEANASEVMSTAFLKAKKEMKDIQVCLQSLRKQMEHFHDDRDDISLPDLPMDSLSPDYFGLPRKAITD